MELDFHEIHREYERIKRLAGLTPPDPERHKRYYKKNREMLVAKRAKYYRDNIDAYKSRARRNTLSTRYGITEQEFDEMSRACNDVCEICGKKGSRHNKRLHIDHDHSSGSIRGLLCSNCNTGLGLLGDSQLNLTSAIEYLNKFELKSQ